MIIYEQNLFGLKNLARVHGSAAYKVVLPAALSTVLVVILQRARIRFDGDTGSNTRIIQHPFAVGAFIGFFSFLLTFRLNFAYQRYWEGASALHTMHSKWLDFATNLAAFHYQSEILFSRPPTLGGLKDLSENDIIGRSRTFECDYDEMVEQVDKELESQEKEKSKKSCFWKRTIRKRKSSSVQARRREQDRDRQRGKVIDTVRIHRTSGDSFAGATSPISTPYRHHEDFTVKIYSDDTEPRVAKDNDENDFSEPTSDEVAPPPSLFLQEAAHLVSLVSGVALSTLRNDMEGAESPMSMYIPGNPWPAVDPDDLDDETRNKYGEDSRVAQLLYFCLGLDRSRKHRTLYNAARPFGVLGGVSDDEIRILQRARGPYAKVALCTMWLQEFISREYMTGSTGRTATPIISRLYQFLSDGMSGYNQARKVAYVPYPFVNAQMTTFFSFASALIFPVLFDSYVNTLWFSCFLNFVSITCFLGLQEVARELENPMWNVPNDLPLTTFQAQFNEAIVAVYAGYHPDSWWQVKDGKMPVQTNKQYKKKASKGSKF